MKKLNLLSKAELKSIKGGDYARCYNICMSGFDANRHTKAETGKKVTACDNACR